MAVLGTVLSVAQTLLAALDNSALRQANSIWSYKSHLDDLKNTVESVKNVLLDAEGKEELSHEALSYIEKLKDAVYDADDLFDEFVSLAEQDQQLKVGKLSKKIDVKKIRRKLDKIADNHSKFGLNIDNKPIRKRRKETCSYVYAPNVIGREADANAVVDVILDTDCEIISIVGVGGIGKTTLAQLVYNHEKVVDEFALKLWMCISDQDGNEFDVKIILCKILEESANQTTFCEKFKGKKYLLVLDDLWNESRRKWTELDQFLKVGDPESRIVVTTRSFETARSVGNGYTYPLQGLSDEHSWSLFKLTTFDLEPEKVYPPDFVEIGKKIVRKCANVPLVVKVIGSLLYGQDRSKWESFQHSKLSKIRESDSEIMSVLMLSYYNLASSLKSCFSYCAIFPKDEVIDKERLKLHWMALGYIVPFDECQSLEDAAEEYFQILLRRCFFQVSKKDKYGEGASFVIHDLMHDVAEHVAMNEIFTTNNMGSQIRHLFSAGRSCTRSSFPKSKIRSCYKAIRVQSSLVDTLVANWIGLMALTLKLGDSSNLPESIGNLSHLRFLALSNNADLEMLPDSITKLHNLQTLYLKKCYALKELPKELNKLVKLRHLHIMDCRLTCMPPGMDKLTSLCKLSKFVVSDESARGMHRVGQLKELSGLRELRGNLEIQICKNVRASSPNDWGSSLGGAEHLNAVSITFPNTFMIRRFPNTVTYDDQRVKNDEAVIENLQLHPNLRELEVCHYSGTKLPMWGRLVHNLESFLPNLIKIKLDYCHQLQQLPPLRKLQYLKSLELCYLMNLEYIDSTSYDTTNTVAGASGSGSSSSVEELSFFPSLEFLELKCLNLKGWWSRVGFTDRQPPFRHLSTLEIYKCFNLTSFPPCPSLESLVLDDVNDTLKITTGEDHSSVPVPLRCDNHPAMLMRSDTSTDLKLTVWLNNLNTLPIGRVTTVTLSGGAGMETLSQAQDVLKSCCSTLKSLRFSKCELRSLTEGLEHLTALESLVLVSCLKLKLQEDDDMPWKALHQNLRSLKLRHVGYSGKTFPSGFRHLTSLQNLEIQGFSCLESLPEWISCLSALQSLDISYCSKFRSFPYSVQSLTSLQKLDIVRCPALMETLQDPSGEEQLKIQHIPHFSII
ncbi:putative disease resistance protein RGA1 [Silene latifolia]|uniref:putative disease resistance protein RGA1 n=1 Tax=Silene latifolia TaxID=37657 RepID=UPI003D7706A4